MRASELAYQSLRSDIMEGMLAPGSVIAEVEQSERLGVSRTPVREAISRLLSEGLAEPAPGRGVIVAPISLANVYALFELRTSLDSTAAALAARRGNRQVFEQLAKAFELAALDLHKGSTRLAEYYSLVDELDTAIDAAAGNRYLHQAQTSLRTQLTRIRKLSKANPVRLAQAAEEHTQIARCIASGDPQLAEAATRLHLANALYAIEEAAASQSQHDLFDHSETTV
ncbi:MULTISPECIES: GntR family transcriptional regulator [Rothia]|uniref:GntR family transcriptional regulator n=1 Tax=Rothia nasimurium TaxID=85336 RepID=A0A1Y1RQ48_9MICC|nr:MULTISPECIES: GntR family transcriptional regulator [Rothia]ORC20250.1 GntR family transcriptional regulator [Rothia nasimurium]